MVLFMQNASRVWLPSCILYLYTVLKWAVIVSQCCFISRSLYHYFISLFSLKHNFPYPIYSIYVSAFSRFVCIYLISLFYSLINITYLNNHLFKKKSLSLQYRRLRARRALLQLKDVPLRTRRALSLYKVVGDSALLVLNGTSLSCNNALLALNWRDLYLAIVMCSRRKGCSLCYFTEHVYWGIILCTIL